MKDYQFFKEDQSKMFSLFGRSRGTFHFNCFSLIHDQCKENNGYVMKDEIIEELETVYKTEYNIKSELLALADSGIIEFFQKPHLIHDFVRMTKNGKILYQAILEIHKVNKDVSYGKYISDIYRRLATIEDGSTSSYQDILLASYEDVNQLKEDMQVFRSTFEDYVKTQKANMNSAKEIMNLMEDVRNGPEFRNYKAIIKDEYNYYRYGSQIIKQIEGIKETKEILSKLTESCADYALLSVSEANETVLKKLDEIRSFFSDEYKELVNEMKQSETECYQKIANTLTLYASDGTANQSICDLILQLVHDAQEKGLDLPDDFFRCFNLFDNTLFDRDSFRDKRKLAEYKKEAEVKITELSMVDKLNLLVAANQSLQLKVSTKKVLEYLNREMKDKQTISSEELTVLNESDYATIFLILTNCTNPEFEFELESIEPKTVEKGIFHIPFFKLRRKEVKQ